MSYLYRVSDNKCIFEESKDHKPVFHSFALESEVRKGIKIPYNYRELFNGREVIKLNESDFCNAMKVYVREILNKREQGYEWRDNPPPQ
jgi:hypothetical protein